MRKTRDDIERQAYVADVEKRLAQHGVTKERYRFADRLAAYRNEGATSKQTAELLAALASVGMLPRY